MKRRLLLAGIIFTLSTAPAHAWGSKGHQIVALIAERHITPRTRETVEKLLAMEGKTTMASVSTWADAVRAFKSPRQPSHSLTLQLDHSGYESTEDCRHRNCVIIGIDDAIRILADAEARSEAKLMALKYLVHLIADLHEPLHTTGESGLRIKLIFEGQETTLHRMWDGDIINRHQGNLRQLARLVEETSSAYRPDQSTPIDWAIEGRNIVRDVILTGPLSQRSQAPIELSPGYASAYWPVIRDRLNLAGRRLANILNQVLDPP